MYNLHSPASCINSRPLYNYTLYLLIIQLHYTQSRTPRPENKIYDKPGKNYKFYRGCFFCLSFPDLGVGVIDDKPSQNFQYVTGVYYIYTGAGVLRGWGACEMFPKSPLFVHHLSKLL